MGGMLISPSPGRNYFGLGFEGAPSMPPQILGSRGKAAGTAEMVSLG